jgi:hypothetical protein
MDGFGPVQKRRTFLLRGVRGGWSTLRKWLQLRGTCTTVQVVKVPGDELL